MYNNQDILKKHTALTVSRKDVDTSFILFPVRLETRFVNNYPVEDINEPDRALYAFKSLWHYVEALRKGNSEDVLLSRATRLMERVDSLDTVYREDRTRLKDLTATIVDATKPTGELAKVWERILVHIPRLATLDVVSDNEATDFLRKLDRVDRTIRRMVDNPDYNGKLRKEENTSFSQSAPYKRARKYMKSCLPVLEQLLPDDPSKSIVNRFSHITKRQFAKFVRVMKFLEIGSEKLDESYAGFDSLPEKLKKLMYDIRKGLNSDLTRYEEYRTRYLGGWYDQQEFEPRKQSLHDKMRSKIGRYHHYTLFAEKMILWSLRMATSHRDIATPKRVEIWRGIASSTIFSFQEEREWLLEVLKTYNDWESNYKDKMSRDLFDHDHRISPNRLNKNNRFIRKRKMHYRKHVKCLLIRVYPDEVAVTQMARGLSAEEIRHARLFWVKYFHATKELEREAAWKSLCSLYTPPRAAFIARKQFPNHLEQLKKMVVPEKIEELGYKWLDPYFTDLEPVSDTSDLFPVPITELMPDRFVVQATLDNGNQKPHTIIQYGRLIPKSLQVGLDLNNQPEVTESDSGLKLGGNLRWMTDYAEAERMGMAITIPLDAYTYFHYTRKQIRQYREKKQSVPSLIKRKFLFQSIYVTGMKEFDPENEKDSKICSRLLQEVFNAHLYGDEGLELLKIGTPTNILDGEEGENSTYDTGEDAQIKEFYNKSIAPLEDKVRPGIEDGDADLLSYLFGISSLKPRYKDNPFLNTANRDNTEVLKQRLVNEACLRMAEKRKTPLTDNPLLNLLSKNERLKGYFNYDVSSMGVFPSFRIGDQPYGIVPVCDFKNMKFRKGDPLFLVRNLLLFLADKWNTLAKEKVVSEGNMYRKDKLTTEERYLQAVGGTPDSTTFYERLWVQDPELLDPEFFNYLRKHGEDPAHTIRTLVAKLFPSLSQFAMLDRFFPDKDRLFVKDVDTTHAYESFDWGRLRDEVKNLVNQKFRPLFKDDAEWDRYITGTFDLFNYRLDAWLTGLLHNRLTERMHVNKRHKISIGAYGWVFNLKEDASETASYEYVVAPSVNQAVTAAVLRSSFNRSAEGSTQDYSLNVNLSSSRVRQALRIIDGVRNGLSVGAVLGSDLERLLHEDFKKQGGFEMDYFIYYLRSAYPLSGSPSETGSLEVEDNANADKGFRDITINVLNGSALLEDMRARLNDDDKLKKQIASLYNWFGGKSDLLKWLRKLFLIDSEDESVIERELKKLLGANYQQRIKRLINLIQQMEDAYDALSDVVTSESVYKLTQGNREAVEALMSSLQTGRNIPEPEVTEIPLTSAHIEQRVFVALDTEAEATVKDSILQQTEPRLDKWMGQALGFDRLAVPQVKGRTITYVPLAELGITPSELVYLSVDWEKFRKFVDVASWLHDYNPDQPVKASGKSGRELFDKTLTLSDPLPLDEAEWAVDSMREMMSKSRELRQNDLVATTETPEDELDRTRQMDARYDKAREYVATLSNTLFDLGADRIVDEETGKVLQEPGSMVRYFEENPYLPLTNGETLRCFRLLFQSFRCGVLDALSGIDPALLLEKVDRFKSPSEFNDLLQRQKDLVAQMGHVSVVLRDRIDKADALRNDKKDPSSMEALKQLLPSSFRVVLPFRLDHNPYIDAEALEKQKAPNWFGNVDAARLENELIGLADVRSQMGALHQVRMFARWNGIDAPVEATAMQIDTEEEETRFWLGTQVPREEDVHDANVYTVLNAQSFLRKHPESGKYFDAAGLVLDFWVEKIPYLRQTAALAFGYDQPDAEPPQAILVGVSTLGGNHNWSEHRLIRTIRSAMHQIKSRAVEPEHLYADRWASSLFPLLRIDPESIHDELNAR